MKIAMSVLSLKNELSSILIVSAINIEMEYYHDIELIIQINIF